jgi:hypothetical protein
MTELSSIPWYLVALPCGALVGAYLVSKLLRLSLLASVVGGTAPLALPYVDLSMFPKLSAFKPHEQIGGAWGILLLLALGWVLLRGILRGVAGPLSLFRCGYILLLCAALSVVVVLFAQPELLDAHAPGWRGTGGLILLSATVVGMSMAFLRIFKSAALLALWSFASLVLASEIFFQKMPSDLVREDLQKIESSVESGFVKAAIRNLPVRDE